MNTPLNERIVTLTSHTDRVELVPGQARELLNLRRLPAMLTSAQTAALLDCGGEHNIPVLIRARLLKPLGHPPPNAVKYFATVEVLELAADVKRLGQIRDAVYEYWQGKNSAKCRNARPPSIPDSSGNGHR